VAEYTIDSVQDLIDLTLLSGKFAGKLWKDNLFKLTTDLDLTGVDPKGDGTGWWPIGSWNSGDFFNGFFDGQGHIISNMKINRPTEVNQGLFGAVDPVSGADVDSCDDGAVSDDGGNVRITQAGRFGHSKVGMKAIVDFVSIWYENGTYDIIGVNDDYIVLDLPFNHVIPNGVDVSVGQDSSLTDNPIKNLGLVDIDITCKSGAGMIGACLGFGISKGFPVKNCYVTGTIVSSSIGAGFIGQSNNGYFLNCWTDVDVTVVSDSMCYLGGFVGSDSINTDCVNCYSLGKLTHIGDQSSKTRIGGFCGNLHWNLVDYTSSPHCAVTEGVGGKVLLTKSGEFKNTVPGSMYAAVEFNDAKYTDGWYNILDSDDDSILIDLEFNGNIASGVEVDINDATFAQYATNSFWNIETSGVAVDGGAEDEGDAEGKTTAEMKQQATFTNWDFDNDWWITESETYPLLRVFGGAPEPEPEPEPETVVATGDKLLGIDILIDGESAIADELVVTSDNKVIDE